MPNNAYADTIRGYYAAIDRQDGVAAGALLAPNYVCHVAGNPQPLGVAEMQGFAGMFFAAMPDLTHTVEELVIGEDRAAVLLTVRGTQAGELMGVPPSGKPVEIAAQNIFRFEDGKIAEQWIVLDALGMLQQIGAMPAPAAA